MISLLQWCSCNNICSRCNRPSTHRKLLAKQRLNLLHRKLSNKALQSERVTSRETSLPLAPPSTHPLHSTGYEIKPTLIGLVQEKMVNGLAAEIPLDHMENFERVCNFSLANGVPPDYVKCTLILFSLDGKSALWLASLPTGTRTTWEQVRAAFLIHFYTKSETAALRHKISNFK